MQSTSALVALLTLGLASVVRADAPNVTAVALPTTNCSAYPLYNETSDTAGPWIIVADSTGNSSVDGNGDTTAYQTQYQPAWWGNLVILQDNTYAKTVLRCSGGQLQAHVNNYVSYCLPSCTGPPSSPSDNEPLNWRPVQLLAWSDELVFESELALPVTPYAHFLDGVQQPGVFLGSDTSSTWAYLPTTNSRGQDVYSLRVVDDGSALNEGEFTGFVKIDA